MKLNQNYLEFWGKAQVGSDGEPDWHPLAYHNLDVAAVAKVLLDVNPQRLAGFAGLFGVAPDVAQTLIVKLVALHDIGKFAEGFQWKVPELYPACCAPCSDLKPTRHDHLGSQLSEVVRAQLAADFQGWKRHDFRDVWNSIAGHHGKPSVGEPASILAGMTKASREALAAYIADVDSLLPLSRPIAVPEPQTLAALSWSIAGLAVLSDWIGSNRDWFKYAHPDDTLKAYWPKALAAAQIAVAQSGIGPAATAAEMGAAQLLDPQIARSLSPLQSYAETVVLPDGPLLAIVEDVTGSGKTEAAILLAARLMKAGRADGIFFALPTMATANAMYDRLEHIYRRLFDDASAPSLVLSHGKRELHNGFKSTILLASDRAATSGEAVGDESGPACAAWIADNRRKAFLAHVGVGTIDQALLAVLPAKYQALRLWGLGNRVLIIDEAHAYDAYMAKEMETLLEFHAALGGSAIILSATLPNKQRCSLAAAFGRGLGLKCRSPDTMDYPLVTLVSRSGVTHQEVATRADRTRAVPVRRIETMAEALGHIEKIAQAGGCVAWIRNAVDDAIEAVSALQSRGLSPVLLHARFAMGHRLDIERHVTETLGRSDKRGGRRGFVLVGTQILEQSLDYDVDAMITDLAPIDLMIQRAGRLCRHSDRVNRVWLDRELLVLSPNPTQVEDSGWYDQVSRRAAAIYDDHGIVWRSAATLIAAGTISTPTGVRGLIEAVYGPNDIDDVPTHLHAKSNQATGNASAARSFANANLLKFSAGYSGGDNQTTWSNDTVTPTRLGQPVVVFRLGKIENGMIIPLCRAEDGNLRLSWALSEVNIAIYRATGVPNPEPSRSALIERAKADWSEWEREQPLLVLEPDGDGWQGSAVKEGAGERAVRYDERLGLRIE
jgi:CRISPR-associated endonuclease/helicase Cas3